MNENHATLNKRVLAAIGLIGIGLFSLMSWNLLWPMIIFLPGLVMLSIALFGGRAGAAAMSIPGMLVSGLGGLMFIQNWTGYWQSWAYAWTLFSVFFGMGLMLMGQRLEERSLQSVGDWFVNGGLIAFAAFAIFFELIIGISGGGGTLGALILVGLGLFLLSRDGGLKTIQDKLADSSKAKRKTSKTKHAEAPLFTGPIVYGSRASAQRTDRLVLPEDVISNEHELNI